MIKSGGARVSIIGELYTVNLYDQVAALTQNEAIQLKY